MAIRCRVSTSISSLGRVLECRLGFDRGIYIAEQAVCERHQVRTVASSI
jgi:hypothetical protein